MECQTIQAQLSAWLDHELDAAAGAILSAHLASCGFDDDVAQCDLAVPPSATAEPRRADRMVVPW